MTAGRWCAPWALWMPEVGDDEPDPVRDERSERRAASRVCPEVVGSSDASVRCGKADVFFRDSCRRTVVMIAGRRRVCQRIREFGVNFPLTIVSPALIFSVF